MKVRTLKGKEMEVKISGYCNKPEIEVVADGRTYKANLYEGRLGKGLGIETDGNPIAILDMESYEAIKNAVEALPKKDRIYRKTWTEDKYGHRFEDWTEEGIGWITFIEDKNGEILQEGKVKQILNEMEKETGRKEFTREEVLAFWNSRYADEYKAKEEKGRKIGRFLAEEEEIERNAQKQFDTQRTPAERFEAGEIDKEA
jgi:hypothetical protein